MSAALIAGVFFVFPSAVLAQVPPKLDQKSIMCEAFKSVGLLGLGCGKLQWRGSKNATPLSRQLSFINIFLKHFKTNSK
jgi:hypothetical protein